MFRYDRHRSRNVDPEIDRVNRVGDFTKAVIVCPLAVKRPTDAAETGTAIRRPEFGTVFGIGTLNDDTALWIVAGFAPVTWTYDEYVPAITVFPRA